MPKRRLDALLVDRGLVPSRDKARALIMAGEVTMAGHPVLKPGSLVPQEAEIDVQAPAPFVSRGGLKLDGALTELGLDVSGRVVLDVGASTGGFTDCLLKRGAERVYALDVGYGQLDYRLRTHPRVVVRERVNARYPFPLPQKVDLATLDLSFISLEKVIPSVSAHLKEGGYVLALVKPQFQAGRREVGKGGLIKDPLVQARVLGRFLHWASQQGFRLRGLVPSPVPGASGNREFFVLLGQGNTPRAEKG